MKKRLHRLLLLTVFLMPWVMKAQDSCEITALPYFNDFESEPSGSYINAFPNCWVRINYSNNNYIPYVAANNILVIHGNKSLYWSTHPYISYPDNEYAVLPAIDQALYDSLISNLTLSFYAKTQDTAAPWPIFIVGVMYNFNDTSSFVPVDTITLTPTVTFYTVDFANYTDSGKYIAIRCPRTSEERRSSLDDIYLNRSDHFCYPPSNLTAVSADNEVTLNWHGNGNSSFTVILGDNIVTGVTDTFYTFHNLHDSTMYNYAVAAECASGNSLYLNGSIQTECHTLTYDDLPYREDFESYGYGYHVDDISPCWHRGTIGTTISHNPILSHCNIDNDTVGLNFGAGSWYSGWAALPKLDDSIDVSNLEVEFVIVRPTTQNTITQLTVGVATDIYTDSTNNVQIGGFVPVETLDLSNELLGSINTASVRFENYTGDGRYIIFLAPQVPDSMIQNTQTYTYNSFLLDNVTLKVANPCPTPQHVRVTHTTTYSVSATWDSVPTADTFIVFVGAAGANISTFTQYNVYGQSVTIDSLNADTEYELVVVAQCEGSSSGTSDSVAENSLSDASYPTRFHTLCAPIDILPYYEDFEGVTGITYPQSNVNNLPHCWLYWNMGSEYSYMGFPIVYTNTSNSHSGINTMMFRRYDSDQMAIMPLTDAALYPISNLQVSFWIRSAFNSNYELVVGVMSDPTDTSTFIPVRTILPTSGNFNHYIVGFANYDGPHGHVAFKAPMPTYGGNQFFIDDVTLEEIPNNCATTTAIHIQATASAARLTWDYNIEFGTPTSFMVNYRNVEDSTLTTVITTTPELLLTGLATDSTYWVSVAAECSGIYGIADTVIFNTQALPCIRWDTIYTTGDTIVLGIPGTGTNNMFPIGATAPYTRVQHLFRANEIPVNGPTTLKGIGFDYAYTQPAYHATNCTIYLAHTTQDTMSNSFVGGQWQMVYVGSLGIDAEGWNYVLFNQGFFEYDGVSNLCITIDKNSGVTTNTNFTFRHQTTTDFDMTCWGARIHPVGTYTISPVGHNMRSNTRLITGGGVYCGAWATCLPPIVNVDMTDDGDYRITWVPGYQEETWNVDYRILDTGSWVNIISETAETEYILPMSALEHGTRYEIRVTANCSDTTLSSSDTITTPCVNITIPFHYGFEELPASSSTERPIIPCWHHLNDASMYLGYPIITGNADNRKLAFLASASTYNGNYQAIVLPPVDINSDPINSLYLNFWAYSSTNNDDPVLCVGVMTDPDDITTFQTVDSVYIDPATGWDQYEVSFENYNGDGAYIAIRAERPTLAFWSAIIDDIKVSNEPRCRRVDNIRFRNVTTDSATVFWTNGDSRTDVWELVVGDSVFYPADTFFTIHNLVSDTQYTVTIRSICDEGDTSNAWSASFHTPCYLIDSLPYTNDFENEPYYNLHSTSYLDAFPACWRRVNDISTNSNSGGRPYIGLNSQLHGDKSLYWELSGNNNYGNNFFVVLPPVDLSAYNTSDLYLMFYAKTISNGTPPSPFVIGVMNHDSDTANFVPVDTITPTRDIALYTVSFANYIGTGNYIAIRCRRPISTRELFLDDIVLTDQLCYPVSHIRASATDTSVTLVWSPENNYSFTAVLGNDTVTGITDTFYTFHPLANTTIYNYAVRAECPSINSIYLTGNIQTECPPITFDDLPYREDFESYGYGYDSTISPCWHRGQVPAIAKGWPSATHLFIGEDTVGFAFSSQSHFYRWAALPRLDDSIDISQLEVNFLIMRPGAGGTPIPDTRLIVGVAEDVTWQSGNLPATTMEPSAISNSYTYSGFIPVDTINLSDEPISTIHSISVRFENYTGSGRYIVFYAPSTESGSPYNSFAIDNVELRVAAPCPTPENIHVTGTTDNSVSANWSTTGNADRWLVYIGTPGFEIGSVSPYIVNDTAAVFGGLNSNTEYEMILVASCNGNEGYPSYPVQFRTLCAPLDTLPFVEDFESVSGIPSYSTYTTENTLPDCWLRYNTSVGSEYLGAPLVHNDATYAHSGNNAMRFHTANIPVSCSDQYAIMPLTDPVLYPARALKVSFWLRTAHYYYNSFVVVGVMSDPTDTATFVAVDTARITSLNDYSHHTVSMARYSGPHGHLAFKAPFQSPVNRPYIDDITLEVRPCSLVEDLHIAYTTTDSIIIAWSDSSDVDGVWYLEYDTADFTPGNGTRTPIQVFDTFYIMAALNASTTYHIYLYPDCLDSNEYYHLAATTLDPPLACPPPQDVTGTVSADSLSLSWTPGGNESEWEVSYSSTTVIVDTPAYTFRDLPLSNGYTVHIRAICSENDTSSTVTISFPNNRYWVTATADDPEHGSVTGGGQYYYGDIATLTAIANTGYEFLVWSDSSTSNPRNLFVTGDTTIIAQFRVIEDTGSIDNISTTTNSLLRIYPNPAKGGITVSVTGISGKVCIVVMDLSGREMMKESIDCSSDCKKHLDIKGLAAGAYFVRVTSETKAPMVKKLIVR